MHIPILFTFDINLEMPAGVCLTSLLENARNDTFYDIFILHSSQYGFTNSLIHSLPDIYNNCRITFREVSNEFIGGYQIRGIPETAYYRLISPELIPEYDKYLYSDVDVIFREDLSSYYQADIGDCYFAGVDSVPAITSDDRKYLTGTLGMVAEDGYYYSGNLVINASRILQDNKTNEFRALGTKRFRYQDMDIINLTCRGNIASFGPSFCLTNYLYQGIVNKDEFLFKRYGEDELRHALKSGIIHYNGAKPWKEACVNMDIWWEYYRKSIFYDEQFCHDFWVGQRDLLVNLSLAKRIKMLLRYPLDKRTWSK
jgi:lipopolysaccharide biosynthesis glycosyltransferase